MLVLIKTSMVVIGAVVVFAGSFFNTTTQAQQQIQAELSQYQVISHTETKSNIIFKTAGGKTEKTKAPVVSINKNNGKVKISFKNKRNDVEFDLEYDGGISPADREMVSEIFSKINTYISKKENINSKVKRLIKDFVNRKL